jgi:eukaryotic-like serine/threonine-protein kinase
MTPIPPDDSALGDAQPDLWQGRYELLQVLGKKPGRQTLLARDSTTGERVVIKRLSFSQDVSWDDIKLLQREAETLKFLCHPALPNYIDSFEFDTPNSKGFAFVQRYIDAPSLEERIQAGDCFSQAEVNGVVRQLLKILIELHDRQPPVIHRDIKPSNILWRQSAPDPDEADQSWRLLNTGTLYLVDFGSVQTLASREGKTMTVVGTYGYMPPEQFGGVAYPASDLYSLGATAIALLTGCHPADIPNQGLSLQFEPLLQQRGLPPLSPDFARWLHGLTHPSLDQRFASARDALAALEHPEHWPKLEQRPPSHRSPQRLKPVETEHILGNAIGRSIAIGFVTGMSYGVLFGSGFGLMILGYHVFIVGAILLAGLVGGLWGAILGVINGLLVSLITRFYFRPLRHPTRYRRLISAFSFLASVPINYVLWGLLTYKYILLGWDYNFWSALTSLLVLGAIPITIASLSMALATQAIARWYERAQRRR